MTSVAKILNCVLKNRKERYAFVAKHKQEDPLKSMCRVLDVSESGYSARRKREASQRLMEPERLTEQIAQAFQLGRGVYGSPRIPGLAA